MKARSKPHIFRVLTPTKRTPWFMHPLNGAEPTPSALPHPLSTPLQGSRNYVAVQQNTLHCDISKP